MPRSRWTGHKASSSDPPMPGADVVRVVVGPEQREFIVHRKLLCATSQFFNDHLAAVPAGLRRSNSTTSASTRREAPSKSATVLWLSNESPEMFELFVLWLYRRRAFRSLVENAVSPRDDGQSHCWQLQWNLIRLHLFAARIALPILQDLAMDSIQDLYLSCNWDISPRVIAYLYDECDPGLSLRLRKWAVAMIAWTLAPSDRAAPTSKFLPLFQQYEELWAAYVMHLDKMKQSKADLRIKNPQLRSHTNSLRSSERHLCFRNCSFHSHRSKVREGACPHYAHTSLAGGLAWLDVRYDSGPDASSCEPSPYSDLLSPPPILMSVSDYDIS